MTRLRVAAAQINATVGDLAGNVERILAAIDAAEAAGADLVALPELAITGYPPEDLLLRPAFVAEAQRAMEKVAARTSRTVAVIGFPLAERDLSNAAAVCAGGAVRGVYRKWLLPNYGVFDEARYFTASDDPGLLFVVNGVRVAVSICEDIWSPTGPIAAQAAGGAELAVNINASPYYEGRLAERETMVATRAADHSVPILYCNLVGGQDELVFDGGSAVIDQFGEVIARAPQFEEALITCTVDPGGAAAARLRDARHRAAVRRSRERAEP
ncbi:MAG TPA: nitrilase-related carbon-nitrogen hydrolase, partial [Acidimicrobiia bacterium]|nr:nitrilase-related carbon-nitrogen hydrolase [Acidimicrobiia bacterium]